MNDIHVTLTGRVAAEPRQHTFGDGARVTSLRVLTNHRYFDKKTGMWADGDTVCFVVRCWRALADNVAQSIQVGHPVVVSGRLRIREFGQEGDRRFAAEVEASSVGHDLRWGVGAFSKPDRLASTGSVSAEMRDRLDEETQDWAMSTKPAAAAASPFDEPLTSEEPVRLFPRASSLLLNPGEPSTPPASGLAPLGAAGSADITDADVIEPGSAGSDGGPAATDREVSHVTKGRAGKKGESGPGSVKAAKDAGLVRVLGAASDGESAEGAEGPVEERVAA
ncbi:single-stranded DNA-binding protein [Nonomuraea sp. NPDC050556]|uniref:single-stranded DNA-binding protein n=1 Tax=Nonomuraea sp. NPDC050556 TaxID=3364369 RepID=UPI00379C66EC